jgi:DNA invertase Pin-like site-specific DNA recombinase
MADKTQVPAAQYLRMSTERQIYSLENQSTAIQRYAESRNFEVVRTYTDAAKTGVILGKRHGLRQLLKDVVDGTREFRVILVYDVSRWGRFQDTDEAAHYEFLCKSAGVPVHYCAEQFSNDGGMPNLIMKALKRTMAGEYSRELGVKVLAGQRRIASLGYKLGGRPGFGMHRMLISSAGQPKQLLAHGDRKYITTDRVILVPGPAREVELVREIYRMFVSEGMCFNAIANELNRRGVAYKSSYKWRHESIRKILTNPKYIGSHVFGRSSQRLYTPRVTRPESEWVVKPDAFQPIVDKESFDAVQTILQNRTANKSNAQLLEYLRQILLQEGRLSLKIIEDFPGMPSPTTFRERFGGLLRAYEALGYKSTYQFETVAVKRRIRAMRTELFSQITGMFPGRVSIFQRGKRYRNLLKFENRLMVSINIAPSFDAWKNTIRWQIEVIPRERRLITLLVRLGEGNKSCLDFHVFPNIDRKRKFRVSLSDAWLRRGKKLNELSEFCGVVAKVQAARQRKMELK